MHLQAYLDHSSHSLPTYAWPPGGLSSRLCVRQQRKRLKKRFEGSNEDFLRDSMKLMTFLRSLYDSAGHISGMITP